MSEYTEGYSDAQSDVKITSAEYAALEAQIADMRAGFQIELASKDARIAQLQSVMKETRAALLDAIEWADECIPPEVFRRIKDAATKSVL